MSCWQERIISWCRPKSAGCVGGFHVQVEISEIREKIAGLRRAKHLREQESMAHRMELLEKIQICNKE